MLLMLCVSQVLNVYQCTAYTERTPVPFKNLSKTVHFAIIVLTTSAVVFHWIVP